MVSDFLPSNFHILGNPEYGYLVNSKDGCLTALRELCKSAEKRKKVAQKALKEFNRLYDPLVWSRRLYNDIEGLLCELRSEQSIK